MSHRAAVCLLLAAPFCGMASGCLFTHQSQKVVREDEPRQSAKFETTLAERAFHARALNETQRKASGSSSSFGVPFIIGVSVSKVRSENAYYNDQLAACDTNHDGVVSETEAFVFNQEFQNDSWEWARRDVKSDISPASADGGVTLEGE